ncbi:MULTISPECIES: DUF6611 family protein [unclassified Gordonia (in: high G+C Gram-positive bacteria)]
MSDIECRRPVVAGDAVWGYVQVGYARQWVRHRLVIYPPGTSPEQRRWLRLWRWVPAVVALALIAGICAAAKSGVHAAVGAAVGAVVALAVVVPIQRRTATCRHRMCIIESWSGPGQGVEDLVMRRIIEKTAGELRTADREVAAGRMTPVEHEALWARCHEQIATAGHRVTAEV